MAEFEIDGVIYEFPDDFSDEKVIGILREQNIIPPPAAAPQETATPLIKEAPPRAVVDILPGSATQALAEEAITKAAGEEVAAATPTGIIGSVLEEEERVKARLAKEQERQRSKMVQPGVTEPRTPGFFGPFRPTEVRERLTYKVPAALDLDAEYAPYEQFPEGFDVADLETRVERMTQDPETGKYRTPTGWEEFVEAFALQPVLTEASAREQEQALYREQLAREKGYYGETPFYDYPGSIVQQAFEQPDIEGRGVIETELAGGLRSLLSWGSAAAAEGYFRTLGYEVDERGFPKDPDDWGYALAQWRESMGIPGVVGVAFDVPEVVRESAFGEEVGLPDRFGFAVPTFGVPSTRTQKKTSTFDPEQRRVVDANTEDWKKRIFQGVAKGRTWGDEFLDMPDMAQWYLANTGNPDHAYLSGLLVELVMPAGPELAASAVGYGGGLAADLARLGPKLRQYKALTKAEKLLHEAHVANKVAGAKLLTVEKAAAKAGAKPGASLMRATEEARVAQDALDAARATASELRAAVMGNYDPALGASLARKAARKVGATDDQQRALKTILRSEKPTTVESLAGALRKAGLPEDRVDATMRLVAQNLPEDLVALTDEIAVPRSILPEAKKKLAANRAKIFRYDDYDKAKNLREVALTMPESQARTKAIELAQKAMEAGTVDKSTSRALDSLARQLTKEAKAAGRDIDVVRAINERPPSGVFKAIGGSLGEEMLNRFGDLVTWDDIPADVRRQIVSIYDIATVDDYGKLARLNRDLTRAKTFFSSAERGVKSMVRNSDFFKSRANTLTNRALRGVESLAGEPASLSTRGLIARDLYDFLLDPRGLQRLRAKAWMDPELYRETVTTARMAKELEQAAATVIRTYGDRLLPLARELGSYDKAIERLLETTLSGVGDSPTTAWDSILDSLYGGPAKDQIKAAIAQEADTRWSELGVNVRPAEGDKPISVEFNNYPSIDQVKALDSFFVGEGVLPGVTGGLLGKLTEGDVEMAFVKATIESGLKKEILKNKALTRMVSESTPDVDLALRLRSTDQGGVSTFGVGSSISTAQAEKIARDSFANPVAGTFLELPEYLRGAVGPRYVSLPEDTAVAAALNKGGEELFRMLDSVPVKQRGYLSSNTFSDIIGRVRRDVFQRINTGYIAPNIIPLAERVASTYLIPMSTIGVGPTLRAIGRQMTPEVVTEAINKVMKRRVYSGGLEAPDGTYYSPRMIDNLANEYGLGMTRLESSRVGSLAQDLRRQAKAQAKAQGLDKGAKKAAYDFLYEEANPFGRSYWNTLADNIERNFRRNVFESGLAAGMAPADAAELARRSNFDYASVPGLLAEQAAQAYGNAGFAYQAAAELSGKVLDNPALVSSYLKAHRERAKYQDPYNLRGDKAIKTIGMMNIEGDDYYLPESPAFKPIDWTIALARGADKWVGDVAYAASLTEDNVSGVLDGGEALIYGGLGAAAEVGSEILVPGVFDAYKRFQEGEGYATQGIPDSRPITDEKAYWAAALIANAQDPYHEQGGAWNTFTNSFPHTQVKPPPKYADPTDPTGMTWIAQPPEGIPHIMWEPGPGKAPRYYAMRPTNEALSRIAILRGLDPLGIDRALPLYSTFWEPQPGGSVLYTEGRLPESTAEALGELTVPRVKGGAGRREEVLQRELIRGVREDVEVKAE